MLCHKDIPSVLNSQEELETDRSILLQLIEDCKSEISNYERRISNYEREINLIDFALASKFYKNSSL